MIFRSYGNISKYAGLKDWVERRDWLNPEEAAIFKRFGLAVERKGFFFSSVFGKWGKKE